MKLNELKPSKGAKREAKRVGRGKGSGLGKTAGRGEKGLRARSGGGTPPGYEGGQMPLQRRIPKRGFHNPFRKEYAIVNVRDLNRFDAGSVVDIDALKTAGIVKHIRDGVKLL
jgi:large subunit ribosomal protein L15